MRQEKCEFHLSELRYLGHQIDATGIGIWSREIPQIFVWSSVHDGDRSQTITFNPEHQGSSAIHSSSKNAKVGAVLLAYQYEVEYKNSKARANADCLSRLPMKEDTQLTMKDPVAVL